MYQDLALVDCRDIASNIFLGREPAFGFIVNKKKLVNDAENVLKQLKTNLSSATTTVGFLSGGQRQAVAIARALAKNPKLLLCDEPTGALDYNTGKAILKLLQDQCRLSGMTVVIITHNSALTAMADRVIHIKNGTVSSVRINGNATPVENIEW